MQKLVVFLLLIAAIVIGWYLHVLLKKMIDPKRSLMHLALFFAAHFAGIFLLLFIFDYLVLHYRNFLFTI